VSIRKSRNNTELFGLGKKRERAHRSGRSASKFFWETVFRMRIEVGAQLVRRYLKTNNTCDMENPLRWQLTLHPFADRLG
jgi:hypothetical protein